MRKSVVTGLLLASGLAMSSTALATPVLSVTPATISPGDTTTIDLGISGLGGGTALGTFDVTVAFDTSILSFVSAAFGDPGLGDQLDLEGFGTLQAVTPGAGNVELFELSFDSSDALTSLQANSFTLAALTFTGLAPGISQLSLSINALGDQGGNPIPATLQGGSIDVGNSAVNVTEPGVLALLALGLVGMGLGGRHWPSSRSRIC